ncbi:hypothetical protein Tco_0153983 [Tanacetum coccineum]
MDHCDPLCEEGTPTPEVTGLFWPEFHRESCLAAPRRRSAWSLTQLLTPPWDATVVAEESLRFPGSNWILKPILRYSQADILRFPPAVVHYRLARVLQLKGEGPYWWNRSVPPLDDEAYPPSSHWPTLTPVILSSKDIAKEMDEAYSMIDEAPQSNIHVEVKRKGLKLKECEHVIVCNLEFEGEFDAFEAQVEDAKVENYQVDESEVDEVVVSDPQVDKSDVDDA